MFRRPAAFIITLLSLLSLVVVACAPASPATPTTPTTPTSPTSPTTPITPSQPSAKVFKWRVQSPYPESLVYHQDLIRMGKMIEEMSGGRLVITPYSSGGIVPAYEELDAAVSGALDASCGGFSEHRNRLGPVVDLFTQYAGGLTAPEYHSWYFEGDQAGIKFVRELYKDLNVFFVGPSTSAGAEDEMWSNRKLQSAADYKGLKIRTYGDWGNILVDFGASVVTLAGSELYPAMERGVIDALEFSTPAIDRSMAFWEVADYLHYPGIHSPGVLGGAFFVNQDRWNELPEDLKYIVTAAAEYTCRKGYATDKYSSGEAIEYYKSQGVEMVRLPDDLMAQILGKCDDMWAGYAAQDAFFSEVWESQKAFVDRWAQSLMVEPAVQSIRAMS